MPWYLSRVLEISFFEYLSGIYRRPLLTAIPVLAVAYALKVAVFPGHNLREIAAASAVTGCFAWGLAFFTALEAEHRLLLTDLLESRMRPLLSLFRRQPA